MPKPISRAEASAAPHIVIVTMDSHFGGAVDRARALLRKQIPGLELTLHAADEFAGDEAALAACRADIGRADIIIAGMLFLEDHFRLVQDAIAARRDNCDALVCCLSAVAANCHCLASCPNEDNRPLLLSAALSLLLLICYCC